MLTTVRRGRVVGLTSSKHFDVSSAFDFPNLLCRYTALNSLKLFRSKIYGYVVNCVSQFLAKQCNVSVRPGAGGAARCGVVRLGRATTRPQRRRGKPQPPAHSHCAPVSENRKPDLSLRAMCDLSRVGFN